MHEYRPPYSAKVMHEYRPHASAKVMHEYRPHASEYRPHASPAHHKLIQVTGHFMLWRKFFHFGDFFFADVHREWASGVEHAA